MNKPYRSKSKKSDESKSGKNGEGRSRPELGAGLTSLVSYRERGPWGRAEFRGNCSGFLPLQLVMQYRPKRLGDPMCGSGTTAQVVEFINSRPGQKTEVDYWGADLSSGFDLQTDELPGQFDLIFVHPPYWDLIVYNSGDPRCLSNCETYHEFVERLGLCLGRCGEALSKDGRLCVLVGDVRKRGTFYPLHREVENMDELLGLELRSCITKVQHNVRSSAKHYSNMEDPLIKHETCVVFKRVDDGRVPSTSEPTYVDDSVGIDELDLITW